MKGWLQTEDGWAVWIGLLIFGLSLALLGGTDALGWGVTTKEWVDPFKPDQGAMAASKTYAGLPGWASLLVTFSFLLTVLTIGAWALGFDLKKFVPGFAIIFACSYLCIFLGNYAYIAATPDKLLSPTNPKGFDIPWSMGLTGEAGYILALLAGLAIGNFAPGLTAWLKEATRPEWFIKTAIVILGAAVGLKAVGATNLAAAVLFRGFAAIVEGYLIYWALVYVLARKCFKFSREWAAPLASGISICGVSAAIATGAAIRARPVVPIMVSSLVVIFAVVELLLLPVIAQVFLYQEPMVAGAWMGLAVKTDGAAVASGKIAEGLILAKAQAEQGIVYDKDWIQGTTATVKMFIDVFIGIWAFVLAVIWSKYINKGEGDRVRLREIWERFPKFVIGYFFTFAVLFGLLMVAKDRLDASAYNAQLKLAQAANAECDLFRTLFFGMTFFAIGLTANFKKLWAEGIGRLALVYVISLFGFIIWIGLAISWIFFGGVHPPIVGGQ
jgi:uncharacterized membrane protein YadS